MGFIINSYLETAIQPDYTIDFSTTDGWTKVGTLINVDTAGAELDVTATLSSTQHSEIYDLGSTLSNTIWSMTFKLHYITVTNGSDPNTYRNWFGLDKVAIGISTNTTHEFIGMYNQHGNATDYVRLTNRNSANLDDSIGTATTVTQVSGKDVFIRIIRQSATLTLIQVYDDEALTNLLDSKTKAVASTLESQRYLLCCDSVAATAGNPTLTFNIEASVKIYDGIDLSV